MIQVESNKEFQLIYYTYHKVLYESTLLFRLIYISVVKENSCFYMFYHHFHRFLDEYMDKVIQDDIAQLGKRINIIKKCNKKNNTYIQHTHTHHKSYFNNFLSLKYSSGTSLNTGVASHL